MHKLVGVGVLLAGLLLAACDTDKPQLSNASPSDLGAPVPVVASPTAVHPMPSLGNGKTSGSFGGAAVQSKPLPSAPNTPAPQAPNPTAVPAPAQAPDPTAVPAHAQAPAVVPAPGQAIAPAPAAGASIENRSIPKDRLDLRGRLVYVGNDGKIMSVGPDGKDSRIILSSPAGGGPSGTISGINLSPNAHRILYTIDAGMPTQRVMMIDVDKAMLLSEKYNGAWSPDGVHVVASDGGRLVVTNVEDGSVDSLGDGDNANWTSFNQVIAVRGGNIWMLPYPASSGTARQITNWAGGAWAFSNRLQYLYTNHILFTGGERDKLGAQGNGLGLWSVDVPSGRAVEMATPGGNDVGYLALAPSGTVVAWGRQAHNSACSSVGGVGWARATGAGQATWAGLPNTEDDFYKITGLSWSPSQTLAFSGLEQSCSGLTLTARAPEKIFVLDPAKSSTPSVLVEGSNPVWITPQGLGMIVPGPVAGR
ncbi:MAG: hypothetical protein ACR2M0_08575 [Chloroflexia bacterium]